MTAVRDMGVLDTSIIAALKLFYPAALPETFLRVVAAGSSTRHGPGNQPWTDARLTAGAWSRPPCASKSTVRTEDGLPVPVSSDQATGASGAEALTLADTTSSGASRRNE